MSHSTLIDSILSEANFHIVRAYLSEELLYLSSRLVIHCHVGPLEASDYHDDDDVCFDDVWSAAETESELWDPSFDFEIS